MPTSKPRVGLTLDVEVYEQVKVIAKAENRSMANLIESWVLLELAKWGLLRNTRSPALQWI